MEKIAVMRDMALKQLKARYAGSFAGFAWAMANPLLLTAVVSYVFGGVLRVPIPGYGMMVVAGMLPWMFFSGGAQEAALSLVGQRSLLRQFAVPHRIIPLSSVYASFLTFAAGLAAVLPLFVVRSPGVAWMLPALVLLTALLLVFTAGAGLFLSMLHARFRDTGRVMETVFIFWLWMTPVFYPAAMVPPQYAWVMAINPMAPFIVSFQSLLCNGALPPAQVCAAAAGWAVVSALSGWSYFTRREPGLAKVL